MRIAWFRAAVPDAGDPLDDSAPLLVELRRSHDIDFIVEADAHDCVWRHFLCPWDLCVYELGESRAHDFIWAYLINYPGVVMVRNIRMAHLRVALFASRCVITSTTAAAELLRARYPEVNVRVGGPLGSAPLGAKIASTETGADLARSGADLSGPRSARFAIFDDRLRDAGVIDRAVQRARDAGATFELLQPAPGVVAACDVVIAPGWPPSHGTPAAVISGMAAGKVVVTMEVDATAEWPAMDPQTWRPRGVAASEPPIAVTIDPRDEEHSLMLAIRRLSSDAALREQLGAAAHAWWKAHATPAHGAAAWNQILEEAVRLSPPRRPEDWPKQFAEDGTELARQILSEFGLSPTDILARS